MNTTHIFSGRIMGAWVVGLTSAFIFLLSPDMAASSTMHKVLSELELRLEPSVWYSLGEAGFQGDDEGWKWKLVYPLDGWMAEICAESRFPFAIGHRRFGASLRARYARSIRVNGTGTDTDWDSLCQRQFHFPTGDNETSLVLGLSPPLSVVVVSNGGSLPLAAVPMGSTLFRASLRLCKQASPS